jgi:hypothetical protein
MRRAGGGVLAPNPTAPLSAHPPLQPNPITMVGVNERSGQSPQPSPRTAADASAVALSDTFRVHEALYGRRYAVALKGAPPIPPLAAPITCVLCSSCVWVFV